MASEILIAFPSRDLLLVTGSQDKDGIKKLREISGKMSKEAPNRITPLLFARRDGKFQAFTE